MSVEFQNPDTHPWLANTFKQLPEKSSLYYLGIQEKQILKNAEEEGLVKVLSEKTILRSSRNVYEKSPFYAGDVRIVYLSKYRLKDISLIDICERLEICVLSGNYIQDITPLKWCINVSFLDLHSNLINNLPKKLFWSRLKKLHTIYLHDNGLSKLEELRSLACSPNITNLTMYDTPLSLKRTYRHCVVNAVWSLKALDYYVVSDEEIIEDASFPQKFKPLQDHLKLPPMLSFKVKKAGCPYLKKTKALLMKQLGEINRIQAKYSPVLLIQKCIRGFLVRLRYHYILDTRLWAAVSIQRFFRHVKGYPNPPPTSPNSFQGDTLMNRLSSMKLDYETYLKIRRSLHKSSISMKSEKSMEFRLNKSSDARHLREYRKRISVDLAVLEGRSRDIYGKEKNKNIINEQPVVQIPSSHHVPNEELQETSQVPLDDMEKMAKDFGVDFLKHRPKSKIGKYFTQYEFLGEVSTENRRKNSQDAAIEFRLTVKKPETMKRDPVEELIIRTVECAEDIRKSVKEIESQKKSVLPPKIERKNPPMNADEKLYMKAQCSMQLACFRAVDRAYKDRKKAEEIFHKAGYCEKLRERERVAKYKIDRHKKTYQSKTLVKKQDDRAAILEALSLRRDKSESNLLAYAEKRESDRMLHKTKLDHYEFAKQFNCQSNSIGKTLVTHDRIARNDDVMKAKVKLVNKLKMDVKAQKEIVRDYFEQTKMVRQAERMNLKGDIDLLLSKNTAVRKQELVDLLNKQKQKDLIRTLSPTVLEPKQMNGNIISEV